MTLSRLQVLVFVAIAGLASCDDPAPQSARVTLSSDDVNSVELVTSVDFIVNGGGLQVVRADTQSVAVPFDASFPLGGADRFYVAGGPANGEGTLRMEVRIDDTSWYDRQRLFGTDSVSAMEFVYRFNVPQLFPN